MGATTKDVRLRVTLDDGENLFLPGEVVTLDADKANALIRMGYATPLYVQATAGAPASSSKRGQKKDAASDGDADSCGNDARTDETETENAGGDAS